MCKLSAHFIQFQGQLRLLSSNNILVQNALSASLVQLLNSCSVYFSCIGYIASSNSGVKLLQSSLQSRLDHLILQGLLLDYEYSLLSRFNIGQNTYLPVLCVPDWSAGLFLFLCADVAQPQPR